MGVPMHRLFVATWLGLVVVCQVLAAETVETLVVLNKVGGTAWLLDPVTGEARAKLDVGSGPHEAAASPDGRTAIVCNYGGQSDGSTLSVIDVQQGSVEHTIDLSPYRRPHGIRYLDADHVLVTAETHNKLLKVDVKRGAVVATYDAGGDVHMVDLSPDAKTAYATAIGSGVLSRIDMTKPTAAPDKLVLGSGTEALAVRPGGSEIWVGNNRDQTVRVVDASSFEVVAEIECGVQPIRVGFTTDGRYALVSCILSGDLAVIDAGKREIERRVELGDFVAPTEMWEGKSESEQQELVRRVVADGARPIGVLAAPDGESIYVAARGQNHIAVVDTNTWTVVRRLPAGDGPDGMAWSVIR